MSLSVLHQTNIALHVVAGTAAIALGLGQLAGPKGVAAHRRRGRTALAVMALSVSAAILGAVLFRAQVDLIGVSCLVGYQLHSARRAFAVTQGGAAIIDLAPALLALASGAVMVALVALGAPVAWSGPKIQATAFGFLLYGGYDVLRIRFPRDLRPSIASAEHAFKMTSLVFAFGCVGLTTLLHDQGALIPLSFSLCGLLASAAAACRIWPRRARYTEGETP